MVAEEEPVQPAGLVVARRHGDRAAGGELLAVGRGGLGRQRRGGADQERRENVHPHLSTPDL